MRVMSLVRGSLHLNRLKKIFETKREPFFCLNVLDMLLIKRHRSQNLMNFKGSSKCTRFIGLLILGILSIIRALSARQIDLRSFTKTWTIYHL